MEYIQRINHFAPTRTWNLDKAGVSWADDNGESGRITYSAITQVKLRFEPSRAERRRFAMRFGANQNYQITNINYRGMWDFVDQSKRFHQFVKAFHENLAQANPDVRYLCGSTKAAYFGNWVLTVFVLAMLIIAAMFFISIGMIWIVGVKILLAVFFLPTVFKLLIVNRPGTYQPDHIPENLLPT